MCGGALCVGAMMRRGGGAIAHLDISPLRPYAAPRAQRGKPPLQSPLRGAGHASGNPACLEMPTTDTRNVLVVDDEPYIGRIIQLKLEAGPYRVELVQDGRTALERLHSDKP